MGLILCFLGWHRRVIAVRLCPDDPDDREVVTVCDRCGTVHAAHRVVRP
jgi:ribosomal protein L32